MFVFWCTICWEDSSQKRFKPVWLDFVLICQQWIRQSINVPAQSCNHVKAERNMGSDNDLAHLLQWWQGASICLWFVGRMLMPFSLLQGNVGWRQTKERLYHHNLERLCCANQSVLTKAVLQSVFN